MLGTWRNDSSGQGEGMTEARCDCGAVVLQVAFDPAEINDCQCSWCQRLGALWAYYPRDQVCILSGPELTTVYKRAARRLEFHRCKVCGLTTHWVNTDPSNGKMGVNARLMPAEARSRARHFQGM
jgi:hypothetical protein